MRGLPALSMFCSRPIEGQVADQPRPGVAGFLGVEHAVAVAVVAEEQPRRDAADQQQLVQAVDRAVAGPGMAESGRCSTRFPRRQSRTCSSLSSQSRMALAISSVMLGSFISMSWPTRPLLSNCSRAFRLILPPSSTTPCRKPTSSCGATRLKRPRLDRFDILADGDAVKELRIVVGVAVLRREEGGVGQQGGGVVNARISEGASLSRALGAIGGLVLGLHPVAVVVDCQR